MRDPLYESRLKLQVAIPPVGVSFAILRKRVASLQETACSQSGGTKGGSALELDRNYYRTPLENKYISCNQELL
jgi:hypothetical protein